MDENLRNLKHNLDPVISPKKYFTEREKQRIRSEIAQLKRMGPVKRKRKFYIPEMLTAITVCVFLALIGGIVGKEAGLFTKEGSAKPPQTATPVKEKNENMFDPEELKQGEKILNFEVKKIEFGAKHFPAASFTAIFNGKVTLSGELEYVDASGEHFPGEIVFHPSKEALEKLPQPKGIQRSPIIYFNNFLDNQEQIREVTGLKEGEKAEATVTLNQYHLMYNKIPENVDYGNVTEVNGHPVKVLYVGGNTGVAEEVIPEYDLVPEHLAEAYHQYSQDWDTGRLKGLEPQDIFLMFWQAVDLGDKATVYSLLHPSATTLPSYQEFADRVYDSKAKEFQTLLYKMKEEGMKDPTVMAEEDSANLRVGDKLFFELRKDEDGVWRMVYLLE
ncbi:MAG TPA: hypothetical protein VIG80_07215 [Bacillaceae bacterium]